MKPKKEFENLKIWFDGLRRSIQVTPENYEILNKLGKGHYYVKTKKSSSKSDSGNVNGEAND